MPFAWHRRLAAIAALLALAWQCLVVQVHVHGGQGAPAATAGATVQVRAVNTGPADDEPLACPLCRQLLQHGQYLDAAPVAFHPPPASFAAVDAVPSMHQADRSRSHAWHSRGPPGAARVPA